MQAFLTGSHAYGEPHATSDVDLVVFCTPETAEKLRVLSDDKSGIVRFGNLNLICATEQRQYDGWRIGTEALTWRKAKGQPVTRHDAKDLLKQICYDKFHAGDGHYSSNRNYGRLHPLNYEQEGETK